VAEGIETLEQLQALRDAGCGFGQGYLFGKAMDAKEAAGWLATPSPLMNLNDRQLLGRSVANGMAAWPAI
jgi:predicted signal transduction protein with EAL and GGDEF domain